MRLRNGLQLVLVVFAIVVLVFGEGLACGNGEKPETCTASVEMYNVGGETKVLIVIDGGNSGECEQSIDLNQLTEALQEDSRITDKTNLAYNPQTKRLDCNRDGVVSGYVTVNGSIEVCAIGGDSSKQCAIYFITPGLELVRAQKED